MLSEAREVTYYYDTDDERPIDVGFEGPFFTITKSPPSVPVSASGDSGGVEGADNQQNNPDDEHNDADGDQQVNVDQVTQD